MEKSDASPSFPRKWEGNPDLSQFPGLRLSTGFRGANRNHTQKVSSGWLEALEEKAVSVTPMIENDLRGSLQCDYATDLTATWT
jgi:hypothetical protein